MFMNKIFDNIKLQIFRQMKIWFRVSAFISHLCGLLGIYIVNFIRQ